MQQQADILSTKAATMRTLIDGGFDPASVIEAIGKGRLELLQHSGNLSVQLQPGGMEGTDTPDSGDTDIPDTENEE